MGAIEEINNMRSQGMQDKEITKSLRETGLSPKEIEDAFNQLRIKNAISAEYSEEDGMEPSIMKNPPTPQSAPLYVPKTQEIAEHDPGEFYSPQPVNPQAPQFNENAQNQMYDIYNQNQYIPQEGYFEPQTGGTYEIDGVIEIAEQVFSEKIKKEQKQIQTLNEFATLIEARITNDHERIKRMESIIDKLQIAILEKIGSYGKDIQSIKNEMGMMQESFEKMVPILHERAEEKPKPKPRK